MIRKLLGGVTASVILAAGSTLVTPAHAGVLPQLGVTELTDVPPMMFIHGALGSGQQFEGGRPAVRQQRLPGRPHRPVREQLARVAECRRR